MKILVKGIEILIDKWNLDLIRDYNWCWHDGRLQASIDGKTRLFHRVIAERMGLNVNKPIFRKNGSHLDFRQSNLIDFSPKQESIRKNILIDEWNMNLVEAYNWCLSGGYLMAWVDGKLRSLHSMLAERMGLDCSSEIDHIDGNRENNHESNLRSATRAQNQANSKKSKNNTSGFIGVSFDKGTNKWAAQIQVKHKHIHLGFFDDIIEAAKIRDRAALKYHGEFARLNFPELKSNYYLSFLFRA